MKQKRLETKEMTQKINVLKHQIDNLKGKLDKKEEERKMQANFAKNDI